MKTGPASIHLYHQPRTTKKRGRIDLYSLATSFEDEHGKSQKKILLPVGELGESQATQIKALLRAINRIGKGLVDIDSLIVDLKTATLKNAKHYLDVRVLDRIWNRLNIDGALQVDSRATLLTSAQVAKILVINRLLEPKSKIATIKWFQRTWLPVMLGVEVQAYDRNKIYRSLPMIHSKKETLERHFFDFSLAQREQKGVNIYYFDGSTSWFEGTHCNLAKLDKEKTRGYYAQVVGLMLITDAQGYPVAWDAVAGNKKDTTEFKALIERIAVTFGIKEVTYCFDRGVASTDNFGLIKGYAGKFISAIRDNQIKDIFDLEKFEKIRSLLLSEISKEPVDTKHRRRTLGIDGFYRLGKRTFFKELGLHGDKLRNVVSFNADIFEKEQKERQRALEGALVAVQDKNHELLIAKRDRDYNATERDLLEILSKHKVRKFFTYKILPLISTHQAQSLRIEISFASEAIWEAQLTDGLLVYVTDHTERKQTAKTAEFAIHAREIVGHYKAKFVIENAFREMKSFLRLRPFHVWTEEHVKAHYDIAIIGYFINNYIYRTLLPHEVSLRTFYQELSDHALALEVAINNGPRIFKAQEPSRRLQQYLKMLGLQDLIPSVPHTSLMDLQ